MRPLRARDGLKQVGIARARMFLKAHLEWLDGAPVAQSFERVVWQSRPRVGSPLSKTIIVNRELLRRSEAALTTLSRHFPEAMPKLVGNVSTWRTNVTAILNRLKSAIHDGVDATSLEAMPIGCLSRIQRTLVEDLRRRYPSSTRLLSFVIWSGSFTPSVRDFLIPWITANAEWIDEHLQARADKDGLMTILQVGDLVRIDGSDCLMFLQPGLGSRSFQVTTVGLRFQIDQFVRNLREWRNPEIPAPHTCQDVGESYGQVIVCMLEWLLDQNDLVRRRATRLATDLLMYPLVQSWQTAWDRFHSAAHGAIRSLRQKAKQTRAVNFSKEAKRIASNLEKKLVDSPLRYPVREILGKVALLADEYSPEFNQALSDLLSAISIEPSAANFAADGLALRMALICEARNVNSRPQAICYYKLSRKFLLTNRHQPVCTRPWEGLVAAWKRHEYTWHSPYNILQNHLPQQKWAEFFELLGRLVGQASYDSHRNDSVAWFLKVSKNVDQACNRFLQTAAAGLLDDCSFEQLDAAAAMESDSFEFVEILKLLGAGNSTEVSQVAAIKDLHCKFAESGWSTLIPSLLRMQRAAEVSRVAMQFQIAASSGCPLTFILQPTSPAVPEWARHLPVMLHQSIAVFYAVFPESRPRIQRILEKHFPDHQKMQTEISTLEQMQSRQSPMSENLHRRLNNLRCRLFKPVSASDHALNQTRQRIDDALIADVFRDASLQVEAQLMKLLGGQTSLCEFAKGELQTRRLELAHGILNLKEPYRRYGLRLLRKRWGNVPWDLELEAANVKFLHALAVRGVQAKPWLAPRQHLVSVEGEDHPWTLAFESNEVELLLMGYYFGTCLSPGDCNFFSAVVNAIDVNKRVLYARNSLGAVVGRCLFAIGDAGTVVVFRPYSHSNHVEFSQRVAQFASELAAEMQTVVSHSDHVSALVAPEWYDDIAHDFGNSIASDGSVVRAAIQQATEETLIPLLEAALRPVGINDSMLELIVTLPEFRARPNLICALLPLLETRKHQLGIATLVTAAQLAHEAGMRDFAARMLGGDAFEWIRRELLRFGKDDPNANEAFRLLVEYRPSAALKVLRATRDRSVRCDDDEINEQRRNSFAACFDALGRPRLAANMRLNHCATR